MLGFAAITFSLAISAFYWFFRQFFPNNHLPQLENNLLIPTISNQITDDALPAPAPEPPPLWRPDNLPDRSNHSRNSHGSLRDPSPNNFVASRSTPAADPEIPTLRPDLLRPDCSFISRSTPAADPVIADFSQLARSTPAADLAIRPDFSFFSRSTPSRSPDFSFFSRSTPARSPDFSFFSRSTPAADPAIPPLRSTPAADPVIPPLWPDFFLLSRSTPAADPAIPPLWPDLSVSRAPSSLPPLPLERSEIIPVPDPPASSPAWYSGTNFSWRVDPPSIITPPPPWRFTSLSQISPPESLPAIPALPLSWLPPDNSKSKNLPSHSDIGSEIDWSAFCLESSVTPSKGRCTPKGFTWSKRGSLPPGSKKRKFIPRLTWCNDVSCLPQQPQSPITTSQQQTPITASQPQTPITASQQSLERPQRSCVKRIRYQNVLERPPFGQAPDIPVFVEDTTSEEDNKNDPDYIPKSKGISKRRKRSS